MSNASAITNVIYEAITDFCAHAGTQSPEEWLQGYLGAKLPPQYVDTIHSISGGIINTLDILEEAKTAMEEAAETGKSAENWFASNVMAEYGGYGEKARKAAAFLNGITRAENSLDSSVKAEKIDISEESTKWQDNNWNEFNLQDTLKGLALEAGKTGLKEVASDFYLKAAQEGISATLADSDFIKNTITSGSVSGLKVAIAAGLKVAESRGLLPPTSIEVLTTIAFRTAESMVAFADVAKGKATMIEARSCNNQRHRYRYDRRNVGSTQK